MNCALRCGTQICANCGVASRCLNPRDVKTTLLNCLAASIPSRERVVTCEEVFEL